MIVFNNFLQDALLEQKRELDLRRQEVYIERTTKIRDRNSRFIRIVIGPRRAGKSFFCDPAPDGTGSFEYIDPEISRIFAGHLITISRIFTGIRKRITGNTRLGTYCP